MKRTLNEEIEMSIKGIDYVDSLVPTDQDCINAMKHQVDEMCEKYNVPLNEREIKSCNYKNKPNYLAIIVFVIGGIGTVLWTLCIYNLIKNSL